jgi:hypothetical protein
VTYFQVSELFLGKTQEHGASNRSEIEARNEMDNNETFTLHLEHPLVQLMQAMIKLTHERGPFPLDEMEMKVMQDMDFISEVKAATTYKPSKGPKKFGFDTTKSKEKSKHNGFKELKHAFKNCGLKITKQNNNESYYPSRVLEDAEERGVALKAEDKVQIWILTAIKIKCAYEYFPGLFIQHPVSGAFVKQFKFAEHAEQISIGVFDEEQLQLFTDEQLKAIQIKSDCSITVRIDKKMFDTYYGSEEQLQKLVVAKDQNAKKERVKQCFDWLKAAKPLLKEDNNIFYYEQKYQKIVELKYGRLYSGSGTVQPCVRELRATLFKEYYYDYDIKSCFIRW